MTKAIAVQCKAISKQTGLAEEDCAHRGLALPAHLCLDPDPRSVWIGARSELHHRPGSNSPVLVGGVLEVIVALAGIGTAVVLYPAVKRQNEAVALGLVGFASPGSGWHPRWRRVSPDDRELAGGRSGEWSVGHRPGTGRPV